MPYEIRFTHRVDPPDPAIYINECCFGGDVVSQKLRPAILERYDQVQAEQEDWGWFLWFRKGAVRLAVDIFCDDPDSGSFRVHLTSRVHRWLLPDRVADTDELDELTALVRSLLSEWVAGPLAATQLDAHYMPLGA